jgi:hypothetical protein
VGLRAASQKKYWLRTSGDAYYRCVDRRPGRLHAGRRVRSQPLPCCATTSLALAIDVLLPLEPRFSALTTPMSGVSATVALIAKPQASKPSRAMPREFIDERPFADGLVGSVEFVV